MITEMHNELAKLGDYFSIGGSRIVPVDEPEAIRHKGRTRPVQLETCRKLRGIIEVLRTGEADYAAIKAQVAGIGTMCQFYNILMIAREIGLGIYEDDVPIVRRDGQTSKKVHTFYGVDGYAEADQILRSYEQLAEAREQRAGKKRAA